MMNIQKLVQLINRHFSEPWFRDGFVRASVNERGDFVLAIGSRDIQIDSDGKFIGAGTNVLTLKENNNYIECLSSEAGKIKK